MILYSTRCAKCKILEMILQKNEIEFTTSYDISKVVEAGFRYMPVVELDDGSLISYDEAMEAFNNG